MLSDLSRLLISRHGRRAARKCRRRRARRILAQCSSDRTRSPMCAITETRDKSARDSRHWVRLAICCIGICCGSLASGARPHRSRARSSTRASAAAHARSTIAEAGEVRSEAGGHRRCMDIRRPATSRSPRKDQLDRIVWGKLERACVEAGRFHHRLSGRHRRPMELHAPGFAEARSCRRGDR